MANTISTAFVNQYKANIDILSQQMGSKLESTVRIEPQTGEYAYYDQISAVSALTEPTTRHADTVILDTPHTRRRVGLAYYTWAELIDTPDKVKMLVDPASVYAQNAAMKFGRTKDAVILTAADATAYTGQTGGTSTAFDSNMVIAKSGGTYSGSTTTLNLDKVLGAMYLLDANDVDSMGRYFVANPKQKMSFLGATEVKSSDYNTVKALVKGEINSYLGFDFVWTTEVTASGTGDYDCFAYHRDALLLAIGKDDLGYNAKMSERDDKNYSVQVFNEMMIGATRMDENAIVKIVCT
jgi:hypothetical protein